jgi:hypothetical protein
LFAVAIQTMERIVKKDVGTMWGVDSEPEPDDEDGEPGFVRQQLAPRWTTDVWEMGTISEQFKPLGRRLMPPLTQVPGLEKASFDHNHALRTPIRSWQGRRKELALTYGEGRAGKDRLKAIHQLVSNSMFSPDVNLPRLAHEHTVRSIVSPDQIMGYERCISENNTLRLKTTDQRTSKAKGVFFKTH